MRVRHIFQFSSLAVSLLNCGVLTFSQFSSRCSWLWLRWSLAHLNNSDFWHLASNTWGEYENTFLGEVWTISALKKRCEIHRLDRIQNNEQGTWTNGCWRTMNSSSSCTPVVILLSPVFSHASSMVLQMSIRPFTSTELSQQPLDGLPWNLVQTFMVPKGWIVITLFP